MTCSDALRALGGAYGAPAGAATQSSSGTCRPSGLDSPRWACSQSSRPLTKQAALSDAAHDIDEAPAVSYRPAPRRRRPPAAAAPTRCASSSCACWVRPTWTAAASAWWSRTGRGAAPSRCSCSACTRPWATGSAGSPPWLLPVAADAALDRAVVEHDVALVGARVGRRHRRDGRRIGDAHTARQRGRGPARAARRGVL